MTILKSEICYYKHRNDNGYISIYIDRITTNRKEMDLICNISVTSCFLFKKYITTCKNRKFTCVVILNFESKFEFINNWGSLKSIFGEAQ
jgi:hypothetical protein